LKSLECRKEILEDLSFFLGVGGGVLGISSRSTSFQITRCMSEQSGAVARQNVKACSCV